MGPGMMAIAYLFDIAACGRPQNVIVGAMVATLKFQDNIPAGVTPGQSYGVHGTLRAGV